MHHGCSGCSSVCACRIWPENSSCSSSAPIRRPGHSPPSAAPAPAAAALYGLWRLLRNISEGEVFIPENVSILRLLSWCCIAAGLVCLFSALYYMPFLIVSAAAAFVGLILRVVKNVFAEAVRLKDENDYTI